MSLGTVWLGSRSLSSLGCSGVGAALLLACLVLTGCPSPSATLVIVSPEDGAVLGVTTDTNPALAGVQTDIIVEATGIAVGDNVELIVDDVIVTSQLTPEDGQFTFEDVTLSPGEHVIRASRSGTVESAPITVTVTSDECFAISFVTPNPSGSRVTLGPADDTDGEACGRTFESTVAISTGAPDGSQARIMVNGAPQATATVAAGVVRFEGVAFDRRAPMQNTLAVEITNADSVTCSQNFPVPIVVDCAGASCTITSPDAGGGFLNQDDDVSDEVGFQGDFEVTTDAEGAGQPVRLIIDGNETGALSALPDGTVASFGNVGLSEGVHRVQAECTDSVGNTTRSGLAEWTVDVTPCPVTLGAPTEGTVFIDSDDLDTSTSGIDIDVSGTCGGDCVDARVGLCSAIDGLPFEAAQANYTKRVELGSSPTQSICAEARDAAGNRSSVMVGVRVVTAAPQLQIASPTAGAGFNVAGTAGRAADLNAATEACDARFEVYCTGVGSDVQILREGSTTVLGTASCVADATAPAPYSGVALFDGASAVRLPSVETGAAYNVVARQTVDRLTGTATPISLTADCVAPQLSVFRPTCGATLNASQDEDAATEDFEYRTNVLFGNGQAGDQATLEIRPAGGGAVTYMESRTFTTSPVIFTNANYGAGGVLDIIARATDAAGNVGQAPACSVTVEDLPSVSISSPAMSAVFDASTCAGSGLSLQVEATTDAPPGSTVNVEVGTASTASTVGAGGAISVCAAAVEGRSVTVRVSVTDTTRGTGSASVTVVVDTMPPVTAIDPLTATVVDRRGGTVGFSWTAVEDAGGFTLTGYELRCAAGPISSEAEWVAAAASSVSLRTVPGSTGTAQSEDVGGFRPGQTRHCVLRASDPTGALTPLSGSGASVSIPFLSHEISAAGTVNLGTSIAPVGDVNGDGIDDIVIGGNNVAYLYFGSSAGLGTAPNVTVNGGSGWELGLEIAGLGDFNGDGRPDFAIAAAVYSGTSGAVFVFYGRNAATPWPADITIEISGPGSCSGADVCFLGSMPSLLGWSLSPAGDFDGDGLMDIAAGAPMVNSFAGRLYVLLGSTTAYPAGTAIEVPGPGGGPRGFMIDGTATDRRQLGTRVATLGGDLDGDMRHDVLIHSAGRTAAPSVPRVVDRLAGRVYSGSGLVSIPLSALDPIGSGAASSAYGTVISGVGDVDGDGQLDVAVADPSGQGRVTFYFGRPSGFAGAPMFQITNDLPSAGGDRFGASIGMARHPWFGVLGDIDGDRVADALLGAHEAGATLTGAVHLLYLDGMRGDRQRSTGIAFGSSTGASQVLLGTYVGDINGDGFSDIALGDRLFGSGTGRVTIQY